MSLKTAFKKFADNADHQKWDRRLAVGLLTVVLAAGVLTLVTGLHPGWYAAFVITTSVGLPMLVMYMLDRPHQPDEPEYRKLIWVSFILMIGGFGLFIFSLTSGGKPEARALTRTVYLTGLFIWLVEVVTAERRKRKTGSRALPLWKLVLKVWLPASLVGLAGILVINQFGWL